MKPFFTEEHMRLIYSLLARLIFTCLKLRYKINIKGHEHLKDPALRSRKGILFLPNHPAEIDPIMMMTYLFPKYAPRPLVVDHFFFLSGAGFFMKLVRAVPIPNFETAANKWKEKRGQKSLETIHNGVEKGENFLIYPSGHLRRSAKERIGGSSFVHNLLQAAPEAKIVLVRIEGLWGSMFSRALKGSAPHFWTALGKGLKILLKNGIFFVPKREVTIEFYCPGDELPRNHSKLELNRYLENFYNQYGGRKEEPLKLISYSAFRTEIPKVEFIEKRKREGAANVPPETKKEILQKLAEVSKRAQEEIKDDMDLSTDLGLDSLDLAGLIAFLDHRYTIQPNHPGDLQTVLDLYLVAMGEKLSEDEGPQFDPLVKWPLEAGRPEVTLPMGATIHESFLRMAERMKGHQACADSRLGMLSYKRMKKAALVLAEEFKKLPGEHIGVLLPSSCAVHIVIQAILLAHKIPVMMNWTTGPRSLNHGAKLAQLKVVISSRKFLENAEGIDLGDLDEMLILMEDLKASLSLGSKLKGLFKSLLSASFLIKWQKYDRVSPKRAAVMLFTSGTESFPKAVPLSHFNILSDLRASLSCIDANKEDVLLGALPPFHSFGFSVTGLMPLIAGFKVFYSPNPTDSQTLAVEIAQWNVTMACLAPSFYKNLFLVAEREQLKSVRYFVTGAEKAPQDLFDTVADLGPRHIVIEGYGITECSPVVTIARPAKEPIGVGQPLPGVELCVIHPETEERLPQGQSGEVCIRGPNVFAGYYGPDAPNPFIEIEGERWYRSGDMGRLDKENNLLFEGRLKRFVKVGGEMISLTALEEEILKTAKMRKLYDERRDRHPLGISVVESEDGRPDLILITTLEIKKEDVNQILRESGFGRIAKISDVHRVSEIPLTGTGKVHFKALNDLAKELKHA